MLFSSLAGLAAKYTMAPALLHTPEMLPLFFLASDFASFRCTSFRTVGAPGETGLLPCTGRFATACSHVTQHGSSENLLLRLLDKPEGDFLSHTVNPIIMHCLWALLILLSLALLSQTISWTSPTNSFLTYQHKLCSPSPPTPSTLPHINRNNSLLLPPCHL